MTAESVTQAVADRITDALPALLARREPAAPSPTRIEWKHPAVTPCQVVALTTFPAVEVVLISDAVVGHERADDGVLWDLVAYTFRIFGTVHGPDFEGTDRARKRLAAALKELLLSSDMPGAVGRGIRTSYSQVGADRDRRTLAAAYVEVTVTAAELPLSPDVADPDPLIEHVVVTAEPEHT